MARRLAHWLKEGGPARLLRNAGTLIAGNAMRSGLGLVSLAVTARGLGPEQFGKLVIAVAFTSIVTQVVAFQSWQAVIRYGTSALVADDARRFAGVVKAGAALDLLAAVVAAAIAAGGVWLAAGAIGIDAESRSVAYLFSAAIVANLVGTPTGVLRVFERYSLFVIQSFLASLVKLLLVGAAYLSGGGLWEFALAWAVSQAFGNLLLLGFGARELARRKFSLARAEPLGRTFRAHPDLASFFVLTNLSGTARTLRDLDVPILGWLLGPGATGTFKIARQLAGTLNKFIDPFFVVVYPDLARLHFTEKTSAVRQLAWKSALLIGAMMTVVFLLFVLVGEPLLTLVLGEAYHEAYPVAVWCVAGAVIWAFAHPISPMLMVYGRQSALLALNVVTSLLYLAAVVAAAPRLGLTGVGAAYAGFLLLWTVLSVRLVVKASAQAEAAPGAASEGR
jgi:O-antigen/teichoic acid export membrane protein